MLKLVGRYEVQERIGQGAMADVYRAYDPGIGRVLAVKVLKGDFRSNPQYVGRFLREAKAAGALSHPNIVTIFDVGEEEGYPYIAMELLDGEPLDQVMQRRGKLSIDAVLAIGLQLADALRYAHQAGVVHRDIKPSNIILGADGRSIKIVDFGIARVVEEDHPQSESLKTVVGQVLGTPRYMSPEQALGYDIDGRSDLFSVGVVLYELLTGEKAFTGASAATLALQITQQEPAPIAAAAPETPPGLRFIVEKLLAKRPERRFADGGQLADALRRELATRGALMDEAQARGRRLPLQAKITLTMATITAVVLLVSVGAVLNRQHQVMQRMALTSGSAMTSFVASNAALSAADNATLPPEQQDWLPVQAFVKAASADPNVQQMTVVDEGGVIRAASDPSRIGQAYRAPAGEPVVQRGAGETVTRTVPRHGPAGFRFVRPIDYAGHTFGRVDVSLSKAGLDSAASLSRMLLIALSLVTVWAVAAVSYTVARLLAAPIRRLNAALSEASKGELDFRISHHRRDEFGELFDGFNRLMTSIQKQREETAAMRVPAPAASESPTAPLFARLARPSYASPVVADGGSPAADADPDATRIVTSADLELLEPDGPGSRREARS